MIFGNTSHYRIFQNYLALRLLTIAFVAISFISPSLNAAECRLCALSKPDIDTARTAISKIYRPLTDNSDSVYFDTMQSFKVNRNGQEVILTSVVYSPKNQINEACDITVLSGRGELIGREIVYGIVPPQSKFVEVCGGFEAIGSFGGRRDDAGDLILILRHRGFSSENHFPVFLQWDKSAQYPTVNHRVTRYLQAQKQAQTVPLVKRALRHFKHWKGP